MFRAQKKIIFLFCLAAFAAIKPVKAQSPNVWTLQQCIDYAIKNNIQVKQSELSAQSDKYTLQQSEAEVLPSLNGIAAHNYNFGRTIDPFTNQFATDKVLSQNFSLSSSVNLFNGLKTYNTIKQNQYNYLASKYEVDRMKNDVSLNVATGYLQILFNEELMEVAKGQVDISNKQVEQTEKLVDAGTLAKGNLYDIQAQLASDELSFINAQNQLDLSYLVLAQLLNLDSVDNFKIVKPEIIFPDSPVLTSTSGQIYSTAVATLPQIKSAEFKLRSSERALSVAKGEISPRLSLNGSYGTGYSGLSKDIVGAPVFTGYQPNGFITSSGDPVLIPTYSTDLRVISYSDQYKDNLNKNIGLQLAIPIFNGFQTKNLISQAKIQKQNADYNLELEKNQLRKTIQQAYADANAALKKYYATLKAHDAIQESFKYAEQKFNLGVVNSLDYVTATGKLLKAQSDLLQAKYDYVFKTKVLDFYQGKPITL